MSNNDPQAPTTVNDVSSDADSHNGTGDAPGAAGSATDGIGHAADTVTTDVGNVLNDIIHGLTGSAEAGGSDGFAPAAAHSIGDLVASIASFDPSNPLGALEHLGSDPSLGGAHAGSEVGAADGLHSASSVDLSDVGSLLSHAVGDIASSNLDLDHLTSNLNLFDVGHVDTGSDGGHHT